MEMQNVILPEEWQQPPRYFSVMPFWFWNDQLDEDEIRRQIGEFEAHGVYGFVIHPRVGLPRDLGWMSDALLHFYDVAIAEAQRRKMWVVLYDEGMYPSGSSSGQVVAANPDFQCRCLAKIDLQDDEEYSLQTDEHLVAVLRGNDGHRMAIIDRKAQSHIRGLHYIGEGPSEDEPFAADLLNPDAVAQFIRCVYDRFAERFSAYFGTTIVAIFTDEPSLLGRCRERDVMPGTTGILSEINRILGDDFTRHLPALWDANTPNASVFRTMYHRAIRQRLQETYYAQLSNWCDKHGLWLTGHPASADDIGMLRFFHAPGQDLVWRWVLPDHPSALEGAESTQAKCSSSAMRHDGRQRNANECCGAYGHELTWDEMTWLAKWCFVRGVNWLFPHAFYYSVRGVRRGERPPDVGRHAPWWPQYRQYADACRRLSWLNTDSEHICHLAILGKSDLLPWRAAKICFQHHYDFNYLEECRLWQDAHVDDEGIHLNGMTYYALVVEVEPEPRSQQALAPLERCGRLVRYTPETSSDELCQALAALLPSDIRITGDASGVRVRHMIKAGWHWFLVFNEANAQVECSFDLPVSGRAYIIDPWQDRDDSFRELPAQVTLAPHALVVVGVLPGTREE